MQVMPSYYLKSDFVTFFFFFFTFNDMDCFLCGIMTKKYLLQEKNFISKALDPM